MMRKTQHGPTRPFRLRDLLLALFCGFSLGAPGGQAAPAFIRGDINGDGRVNLADSSYLLDALFLGAPAPGCLDAADVDDDGHVTAEDAAYLIQWLVRTSPNFVLRPPFPSPGADPTPEKTDLGCKDPGQLEPGGPVPGYEIHWLAPPAVNPGDQFTAKALATTGGPIECFSIAYRIDRKYVASVSVDLKGTAFPSNLIGQITQAGHFRWKVLPSAKPGFDLLLVACVYALDPGQDAPRGGEGGGGGLQRIPFAATLGPINQVPLLSLIIVLRTDAPLNRETTLLTPALSEDFVVAGDALHGLQNGFGSFQPSDGFSLWREPFYAGPIRPVLGKGGHILRGDSDANLSVQMADAIRVLSWRFNGAREPECIDAADANDDGRVDVSDALTTLGCLFLGSSSLPAPGTAECGADPTLDDLPCAARCDG